MRQMKVLHLVPPGFGGIDAYIFSHYKYMDRKKFRFDFLTQNAGLESAPQYRDFPYAVRLLPTTAGKDRALFERAVKGILAEGYDVFHLHTSFWTGFLLEELAREAGVPRVILHAHSSFIDEPDPEKRMTLLSRHEELKRAFPANLASDYCACSKKAAGWLFGPQIPKERIRMMKNAIEPERFRFHRPGRDALRAELGLDDGALVLGTVGRLSFQKNHAFLMDVFEAFQKIRPDSRLLIIGDGELRGELERQIRERRLEKQVLLPGWRADVGDCLRAMDCFVLPSRFEGNPISLIEAAASGLPAIISDTITEEAVIADTIRRVPLDGSAWVSALEEITARPAHRGNGVEIVGAAGCDVARQAEALARLYAG